MKKNKTEKILIIIICSIWLIGFTFFLCLSNTIFRSKGIEQAYFEKLIGDYQSNYLEKLRDTHLGYKTLNYINPEIILFGDSHTYAGWDFDFIQNRISKKIGVCAISGAFPENLDDFLSISSSLNKTPKVIIFGIQPRMFWAVKERTDRVTRAKRAIFQIPLPKENLINLFTKKWKEIDNFIESEKTKKLKKQELEMNLLKMDSNDIDKIIYPNEKKMYATNWWIDYALEGNVYDKNKEISDSICRKINNLKIKLILVYIPESQWLVDHYSDSQKKDFVEAANQFKCATLINLHFLEIGGLENKFFINRGLLSNYPYELWNNFEAINSWLQEDEKLRRFQLFDPDHLNSVGATYFTNWMMPLINDILAKLQ